MDCRRDAPRAHTYFNKMNCRSVAALNTAVRWACLATASFALSACDRGVPAESPAATAVTVKTAIVTAQTFTERVGALGIVTAQPGRSATLSPPALTRVTRVNVVVGDRVSRGQALVVLDQTVFREATKSGEARLVAAQRAHERARNLAEAGILPRKDADQTMADLAAARSELVAARRTEQLAVLRSPINGVVTRMSATIGASVDPGQPLVEVADPSALDAILGLTPTDAGRIRPGNKVELRAGQSQSSELLGVGTIREVAAAIDSVARPARIPSITPLKEGTAIIARMATTAIVIIISINVKPWQKGDAFCL